MTNGTSRLNQVIAIEKGIKSKGNTEKSEFYKIAQKPALFSGFVKRYRPLNEQGEKFPDEKSKVQYTAQGLLTSIGSTLRALFDVEATKDYANCIARADVVVDGRVLVEGSPATFLLYLDKELTDLATFAAALPTLSEDEDWTRDENAGIFKTDPTTTHRTKKMQRPIVLYPATPEHPAQTQLVTDDELVGFWEQTKHSGALTVDEKKRLQARIQRLADAVKAAREQANMVEAKQQNVGAVLTGWLFGEGE